MNHSVDDNAQLAGLLEACAARDARAFEALYRLASPRLLGCLFKILRRRALAEEALQDAFLQVWNRADQFDAHRGRPWAWLLSMARYRAIDILRRERADATDPLLLAETLDLTAGDGDVPPDALESAAVLERCFAQLGAAERDSIRLAFIGGRSHPEVARELDRPLGSVKSWIRRGLAALRECIETCSVRAAK
jgi:RNA polymerase sigma-70 factor (ECF subfamily)